jgi:hypothetical protein
LPIPLPAPSSEGRYQVDAIIQRISKAVGFFIVPTPSTGSPSSGTGTLIEWQGTKFFVSALHCFFHDMGGTEQVIRSWNATRFGFRDEHGLGRTESLNEAEQRVQPNIGQTIPISAQEDFLIDSKHDLIAVRIPPALDALAHAEFINLETEAFTKNLVAGTSLIALGAPIASRVHVLGFGETLIPQVEHVRYDPYIDTSGMANDVYSPSNLFMPYSLTKDGIAPHGFSGAAVFVNKEPAPDGVWSVSPHIVGIVQQFAKRKGFLIVRKISTVIDLLNTDRKAV